jgi:branched-chain amino acid transport system ATP-binding protein
LLDEVMAGLNPSEMEMILARIKDIQNNGITVLLIEHVMEAVTTVCDRIVVLNYGEKISEGSPSAVMEDGAVIDAYLGDEMINLCGMKYSCYSLKIIY